MNFMLSGAAVAALVLAAPAAFAAGELHIYNWGEYTSPELIEKFEKETGIDVTITDYDSNDTALAKIEAGGHGFDMVVPSANFVPIYLEKGLLLEARPDQMENFRHVDPRWVDVDFDPGRRFTTPWLWGTVGLGVNRELYTGDIDTAAIVFDPPAELKGKINVIPEMGDVMAVAIMFEGGQPCTTDRAVLRKVRDRLAAAREHWLSMDYDMYNKLATEDVGAAITWNGDVFRARLVNPSVEFGYPREGFPVWMDNLAILADAQNVENAKTFMNFVMAPEHAAMNSATTRYANGILGAEAFMPADMKTAREIAIPPELAGKGVFLPACPPEATELYSAIWTEILR
jgi:spermidine/putrescine transport system substrate-binding protein